MRTAMLLAALASLGAGVDDGPAYSLTVRVDNV